MPDESPRGSAAPAAPAPPAAPARRPPSVAHRLEFGALRALIRAVGALPWDRATAAGARLARLGYAPLRIRRGVVERQIAAALPEIAAADVRRIARASYAHLGRVTVETALLSRIGRAEVLALVDEVHGWEIIERQLALGRGLILLTGHLGNWELSGAYVAARGIPIDAVARRMGNPLFDDFLTRTRARLGMTVVRDREAVRRTPRTLHAGHAVGFLADQAGLHIASSWIDFFGRPAKTPRGPAIFALRYDAPVAFGVALRKPDGHYRIDVEELPVERTGDRERDADRLLARYAAALERQVRRAPEQYFWHHRRWKHAAEPAPDRAPAARGARYPAPPDDG